MENLRSELDDSEELAIKQKREISDLKNAKDALDSEVLRMQKNKRRMQTELDQLNAIFDQERNEIADLESKVKRANKVSWKCHMTFKTCARCNNQDTLLDSKG